ncbi:hypothetical protein BDV37DRAFT_153759 [Aspergillus pseudonomiae]|uniref:Uncharacterized protein n=1 Tax=Aspergillus pseudonomiae TaxID=1506151 RepID=A0A5N7D8K5_9EURO|nr:uncharacterized protein BDV37DRAFT_153759 [Aspergillus pseudonomiae]KAE8402756.1 hypothetical protein BDV37DRAFT_153759 [Aspergillus pseudonomiae]
MVRPTVPTRVPFQASLGTRIYYSNCLRGKRMASGSIKPNKVASTTGRPALCDMNSVPKANSPTADGGVDVLCLSLFGPSGRFWFAYELTIILPSHWNEHGTPYFSVFPPVPFPFYSNRTLIL